jgi:hypothetical protein
LGDFNSEVGREEIPTIGNENLHKSLNNNGVRVVNFATSINFIFKITIFPHRNIHKYNWTSKDMNSRNQIDHILIGRRRHSSVLDVRPLRAADCDTDHYLVVAKIRERLAVNKQGSHKCHMERFNLNKLNEVEGKEKYHVEVSKRFASLEDLNAEVEINIIWETVRANREISAKETLGYDELNEHKPWCDEGCSKLLDQRKQHKLQWLRNPSEIMGITRTM